MQLAGIGLSISIGIVTGILVGAIYKIVNRKHSKEQFSDGQLYNLDYPPSISLANWKQY